MALVQILLTALLAAFYAVVGYLILSPQVSAEYRAYYIERSTTDWRPVRYEGTLEEGFDFSRPGYPSFVRAAAGISVREEWGRWTDARLLPGARIVFSHAFSGKACVSLKTRPAGRQVGESVVLRFDGQEARLVTADESAKWYQVQFHLDRPSDTLEIVPSEPAQPREWDPSNRDPRKLGLALYRLVVVPGQCKEDIETLERK